MISEPEIWRQSRCALQGFETRAGRIAAETVAFLTRAGAVIKSRQFHFMETIMPAKFKLAMIYFLQFIPIIIYSPDIMEKGLTAFLVVVVAMLALGYFLLRGRSWALKMSIFLQGFNIIIRIMMGFSHAIRPVNLGGGWDVPLIVTSILGIAISMWFLLRLDMPDVHATIVA